MSNINLLLLLGLIFSNVCALPLIAPPEFVITMGCSRCIRNGFKWCTRKPVWYKQINLDASSPEANNDVTHPKTHYSDPTISLCCNPAELQSTACTSTFSSSKYILNTNADSEVWCSTDFAIIDKALLACPIETLKCNVAASNKPPIRVDPKDPPVYSIAQSVTTAAASQKTWQLTGLTKNDHCTIIVKAPCFSPGLAIDSVSALDTQYQTDFDIHYYEYNYNLYASDAKSGLEKNNGLITSEVAAALDLTARPNYPSMVQSSDTAYRAPIVLNKKDQPNAELGLVKQLVKKSTGTTNSVYRYIPGSTMIDNINIFRAEYKWFKERILVNYNKQLAVYDKAKTTRAAWVGQNNIIKTLFPPSYPWTTPKLPPKPAYPPTPTPAYSFVYLPAAGRTEYFNTAESATTSTYSSSAAVPQQQVQTETKFGGWGSETAGMLTINGGDKSFGVFGQGKRTDYDGTLIDGTANGVMESSRFTEMPYDTCKLGNPKSNYLAISVVPKSNTITAMGTKTMKFTIGTYAWGNYYSFANPVIPSSALQAAIKDDGAKFIVPIPTTIGLCLTIIQNMY